MTGARPNGRHTCVVQVTSSDRAGLRRVQRDLFCAHTACRHPHPGPRLPACSGHWKPDARLAPDGSRAGLLGSVRDCAPSSREGRAGTVRGLLGGSRPSGAIAHIKFASCRKGVKSPLLKTDLVTPVTQQDSCQVRACHCIGVRQRAIGHVAGGLSSSVRRVADRPSWAGPEPPGDGASPRDAPVAHAAASQGPVGGRGGPAGSSAGPVAGEAVTGSMASRSSRAQTAQCRVRWR